MLVDNTPNCMSLNEPNHCSTTVYFYAFQKAWDKIRSLFTSIQTKDARRCLLDYINLFYGPRKLVVKIDDSGERNVPLPNFHLGSSPAVYVSCFFSGWTLVSSDNCTTWKELFLVVCDLSCSAFAPIICLLFFEQAFSNDYEFLDFLKETPELCIILNDPRQMVFLIPEDCKTFDNRTNNAISSSDSILGSKFIVPNSPTYNWNSLQPLLIVLKNDGVLSSTQKFGIFPLEDGQRCSTASDVNVTVRAEFIADIARKLLSSVDVWVKELCRFHENANKENLSLQEWIMVQETQNGWNLDMVASTNENAYSYDEKTAPSLIWREIFLATTLESLRLKENRKSVGANIDRAKINSLVGALYRNPKSLRTTSIKY